MAKFCVKCRAALEPDARFCDECGAPVRRTIANNMPLAGAAFPSQTPAAPVVRTVDIPLRKVGIIAGGAIGALIVLGGIVFVLTKPPSTPSASDIEALLNSDKVKIVDATCLSDFPYEKSPVTVNGFDGMTLRWMQVLSKAGIYSAPQTVQGGFTSAQQFTHTPDGEKEIHNGKLCFADGFSVSDVQFTKPVKVGKQWQTSGSYRYGYRHPDAWTLTPEAIQAQPDHFGNLPRIAAITLTKTDNGWQIANNAMPGFVDNNPFATMHTASLSNDGGAGLFSRLTSMFSGLFGSSQSLVGQWQADGRSDNFGFTAKTLTAGGETFNVTYVKDGKNPKRIQVREISGDLLMTAEIIDDDHLEVAGGNGLPGERFHRVK